MLTIVGKHLMGAGEIGDRLGGVSRQRVQQIVAKPGFPKPYDELQMGKVWLIDDVEAWVRANRPDLADTEPGAVETPVRKGPRDGQTKGPRSLRRRP
jgi:prophage regulatory protein